MSEAAGMRTEVKTYRLSPNGELNLSSSQEMPKNDSNKVCSLAEGIIVAFSILIGGALFLPGIPLFEMVYDIIVSATFGYNHGSALFVTASLASAFVVVLLTNARAKCCINFFLKG